MSKGVVMKVQRMDVHGGFIKGPGKSIRLMDVSLAADGVANVEIPRGFRLPAGGNYTVRIYGVTGAHESDLNFSGIGELTFTVTGTSICTTGVATTGRTYVFPVEGCYVIGLPLEDLDQDTPNKTVYDWDE